MPEHPKHPSFGNGVKQSPIGSKGGVSYRSITVNLMAGYSYGGPGSTANVRFRIYEINNNSARNWVRTAFDSGNVDGNAVSATQTLITGTITATEDVNTFYATRIEYDNAWSSFGMSVSFSETNSNNFEWSQGATHPGTFADDSEINARISNNVSVGSGFPSAALDNQLAYDVIKLANADPLWAFLTAG